MTLTRERFISERNYALCVSIIQSLTERGLITPEEAEASKEQLIERFEPQIGGLVFRTGKLS